MKKLIIILIIFSSGFECFSQHTELIADCQKIILKTFKHSDSNPIHNAESDSINKAFKAILLRRDKTTITWNYNTEIESLFRWIYNNGYNEYEDSPDLRRTKMRRSICFASIALISDLSKSYTFLEYAKLSIIETIDDPDDELLENSYLGLLVIELMLKIEEDRVTQNDVDKLDNYLNLKKNTIFKQNYIDTKELIVKCKLVVNTYGTLDKYNSSEKWCFI